MSLLLQALKQTDRRPLTPLDEEPALDARDEAPVEALAAAPDDLEIGITDDWSIGDEPAESTGETTDAVTSAPAESIEPIEPFAPTEDITWERLEALHRLVSRAEDEDTVAIPTSLPREQEPDTDVPCLRVGLESSAVAQPLPIRQEYRELCDHLLARFAIREPCTLIAIDAGRTTNDASWLMPLAVAIVQHLNELRADSTARAPRVLLVEAAGPECGIALGLGLECRGGLSDVLAGQLDVTAAVQPTEHPQIQLLARGEEAIEQHHCQRLAEIWSELKQQFDVLLVATGPLQAAIESDLRGVSNTASLLLPLADAAILFVELDGTPQKVAMQTQKMLAEQGLKTLGCVVHGDAA